MSDVTSALPGAHLVGFVEIAEAGLQGMITLRGDLASPAIAKAVQDALGLPLPECRKVTRAGDNMAAWMSYDELLLILPNAQAEATTRALQDALADEFATIANVSDARAVFTISGTHARNALAKLAPVDFSAWAEGDIRRTRAAQVACALIASGPDEITLICFRSVAQYMFDLLTTVSATGSEPQLYS